MLVPGLRMGDESMSWVMGTRALSRSGRCYQPLVGWMTWMNTRKSGRGWPPLANLEFDDIGAVVFGGGFPQPVMFLGQGGPELGGTFKRVASRRANCAGVRGARGGRTGGETGPCGV